VNLPDLLRHRHAVDARAVDQVVVVGTHRDLVRVEHEERRRRAVEPRGQPTEVEHLVLPRRREQALRISLHQHRGGGGVVGRGVESAVAGELGQQRQQTHTHDDGGESFDPLHHKRFTRLR